MAGIRVADRSDEPGVVGVMTLAFANDPACRFLFPVPVQYLTFFPDFVRLYGGRAFDHGGAHVVAGNAGAALWLPPDVHPDEAALDHLIERAAHLDSSHPDNVPFCERLGFELLTTIEIGAHPPMFPMRRHPR
jgi:hypothetical protein